MKPGKLIAGAQLKKLRLDLGLTQKRMAEELGISTSYLTLIEKNQRPVTAALLVKLVVAYEVDLSEFGASDTRLVGEVHEALRHPLFKGGGLSLPGQAELEDAVAASPQLARLLIRLSDHARQLAGQKEQLGLLVANALETEVAETASDPIEEIRQYVQQSNNYFPIIEEHAEALAGRLMAEGDLSFTSLARYLETRHHLKTQVVPINMMSEMLRYYDRHSRRVQLSELLSEPGKRFHLAYQIGQLEMAIEINSHINNANFSGKSANNLAKVMFCNYFAAALLMPYTEFINEVENTRYDLDLLYRRFSVSFEQVAHRITTLQRPGKMGIPFFFVRIDIAGNVTKRFSSDRGPFSKSGGACPKWNIHHCFANQGQLMAQQIELPNETRYFSLARTVTRAGGYYGQPAQVLAIGLGCHIRYANRLIYSDQFTSDDTPSAVGVNCYVCPRVDCRERAFPPVDRQLTINDRVRGVSPFQFA